MTSSSDFWPKLVMASRSSSVLEQLADGVDLGPLEAVAGRSERSRSSIGRSRSGEPVVAGHLAELEALGLVAHVGDEGDQRPQRVAGRGERLRGVIEPSVSMSRTRRS